MFKIMADTFGPNFVYTDKVEPGDFFETMVQSVTRSIDDAKIVA